MTRFYLTTRRPRSIFLALLLAAASTNLVANATEANPRSLDQEIASPATYGRSAYLAGITAEPWWSIPAAETGGLKSELGSIPAPQLKKKVTPMGLVHLAQRLVDLSSDTAPVAKVDSTQGWPRLLNELLLDVIGPGKTVLQDQAIAVRPAIEPTKQATLTPDDWDLFCELAVPIHIALATPGRDAKGIDWGYNLLATNDADSETAGDDLADYDESTGEDDTADEVQPLFGNASFGDLSLEGILTTTANNPAIRLAMDETRSIIAGITAEPLRIARAIPAAMTYGEIEPLSSELAALWFGPDTELAQSEALADEDEYEDEPLTETKILSIEAIAPREDLCQQAVGSPIIVFQFPTSESLCPDLTSLCVNQLDIHVASAAATNPQVQSLQAAITRPMLRGLADALGQAAATLSSYSKSLEAVADSAQAESTPAREVNRQKVSADDELQAALQSTGLPGNESTVTTSSLAESPEAGDSLEQ